MGKYGQTALLASRLVTEGKSKSATDAWEAAAQQVYPNQNAAQKKGCPKGAYLGLCEEGLVQGVPQGDYTRSQANKSYALEAIRLLKEDSEFESDGSKLWKAIMKGANKVENSQMDVVLTLWNAGLIQRDEV